MKKQIKRRTSAIRFPSKVHLWVQEGMKNLITLVSKHTKVSQAEQIRLALKQAYGLKLQDYEQRTLVLVKKEVNELGGENFLDI